MNKKLFPIIGAVIAVIVIIMMLNLLYSDDQTFVSSDKKTNSFPLGSGLGVSYTEVNYQLKQILEEKNMTMSSPIKLDDLRAIWTYCQFFEGEEQKLVEYCTSTELLDSEGDFLGNIHAFGTSEEPKRMMVVIQVDPFLNQKEDAKTVFSVLTDNIVCECWNVKNNEGKSMNDWAEAYISWHITSGKPTTSSSIISHEDRFIQMKLLTNEKGYEWRLLIA